MAIDNKYQNNLVLTQDAFQDLLTNIKNYPIIDIDYMSENAKDELHTDKDIWETYTDGSPCIRITYGDERNIRGNLTQTERNSLYNKERELKTKKGELQAATYRKTVLNAAWEQNSIIQDEKIKAIETLKNSANAALSTNKTEFLTEVMSLLNKGYSTTAPQIDTTSTTIVSYSKVTWTSNNASNTPVVITTSFLNATVETNLKLIVKTIQNSTDYNLTTTEKNVLTNIYNFIDNFNNLIFYDAKKQYQGSSKPDPNASNDVWNTYLADLPEDVIQYLDFSNIRQDFNFNTNNNGVYNITTNNILTIVNKILSVIQTNLKALKIEINNLNSTISNLETVISTKETEINNIFNTLKTRVTGVGAATAIYGYKYVKVGSNITFANNFDSVTTPVTTTAGAQKSGTFRITIDGKKYEVPIKGFGTTSNQIITLGTTASGGITLSAKNGSTLYPIILDGKVQANGVVAPSGDKTIDLGTTAARWKTIYGGNLGSSSKPFEHIYADEIKIGDVTIGGSGGTGDKGKLLRGDGAWSNQLDGPLTLGTTGGLIVTNTADAVRYQNTNVTVYNEASTVGEIYTANPTQLTVVEGTTGSGSTPQYKFNNNDFANQYYTKNTSNTYIMCSAGTSYNGTEMLYTQAVIPTDDPAAGKGNTNATVEGSITTLGGIAARKSIKGYKVHGAVFNDYAEYRHTENIQPGRCVIETGNGDLILATERMQLGANIVSDTFGFSIGETSYANTPIAVCGRVLAYPDGPREMFKPGEAVCSGSNGTISRMRREEIRNWPDAIVGYVSEIPQYEKWGADQVNVDGRIWIKVK